MTDRWKIIENKRTLADCAVDGMLSSKGLVTPDQAHGEAIRWLERLERGEISTLSRRDQVVELTPVELEKRLARYGDLAKHHQKINSEYSSTTHKRMQNNREEFFDYQRKLDEKRRGWSSDPRDIIISRIKTMSPLLRIGDFGCGTAKLMEEIGYSRVKSFDHVAVNERVIECDIRDLSDHISDGGLEIVVLSLSLMGKNWPEYIIEAKRCLSTRGSLFIAVATEELENWRRLSNLPEVLIDNGFVVDLKEQHGKFTIIEATKI